MAEDDFKARASKTVRDAAQAAPDASKSQFDTVADAVEQDLREQKTPHQFDLLVARIARMQYLARSLEAAVDDRAEQQRLIHSLKQELDAIALALKNR